MFGSKKKTILVVDDDITSLTAIRTILEGSYEVSLAKSVDMAINVPGGRALWGALWSEGACLRKATFPLPLNFYQITVIAGGNDDQGFNSLYPRIGRL